ncbi:unnamed protein product [Effrenium voratum]|nr:unnamed protein product [Effrenium voratum]
MDVVLMELGERNPSERNSSKSRRKEAGVGASDEELRPEGSCLDSSKSSEICTWSLSDSARTITFPCPKADKDIQVNMTSEMETKCTQTEFTCDGEGSDFICYHCLMARPPLAPAPRGHSPDRSRSSSRGRRRRRSHISLRSADTATLTAVWSGLMPQHVLMLPEFRKTGPKHVARAIAMLMKQWNLEHPQGVCCRYHAVASLLVFLLTAELKAKCKPAWTPNGSWQCRECGFMHRQVTEECTHCAQYGHWAAECQET